MDQVGRLHVSGLGRLLSPCELKDELEYTELQSQCFRGTLVKNRKMADVANLRKLEALNTAPHLLLLPYTCIESQVMRIQQEQSSEYS